MFFSIYKEKKSILLVLTHCHIFNNLSLQFLFYELQFLFTIIMKTRIRCHIFFSLPGAKSYLMETWHKIVFFDCWFVWFIIPFPWFLLYTLQNENTPWSLLHRLIEDILFQNRRLPKPYEFELTMLSDDRVVELVLN